VQLRRRVLIKMGVFWQSGRGHPKSFGALRAHSFKRTPLLKFLDPPLSLLLCAIPLQGRCCESCVTYLELLCRLDCSQAVITIMSSWFLTVENDFHSKGKSFLQLAKTCVLHLLAHIVYYNYLLASFPRCALYLLASFPLGV